jgi:hypothetical protein
MNYSIRKAGYLLIGASLLIAPWILLALTIPRLLGW